MNNTDISNNRMTNGKATASLILGVISILFLVIFPLGAILLGVIGIILGSIGVGEINKQNQEGKKIAVAGIVSSSIGVLLPIVLIVIGFVVYMNA